MGGYRTRVRTILAGTMLALTATASPLVAEPAAAATSVTACFVVSQQETWAYRSVYLEAWFGDRWAPVASSRADSRGCAYFNTGAYRNHYVKITAMEAVRSGMSPNGNVVALWGADSPLYAYPGMGSVHLGTAVIQCYNMVKMRWCPVPR